jgi:hypothetical protein
MPLRNSTREASFVVSRVDGSRPIEIDTRSRTVAVNGNQPERPRRLRRLPALERIVERPGDEGAHADALGGRRAAHLRRHPVVK